MEQKFIWTRIWHGYLRKQSGRHHPKELGGLFGGHVVMEINGFCYGFFYRDRKRIHVLSKRPFNCEFQKQTLAEWEDIVRDKKETKIRIPLSEMELNQLEEFYQKALQNPPYDYTMLGQRCASSVYCLLKDLKLISGGHHYWNAFYPGALRRHLLREAKKQHWEVRQKPGAKDRLWA
jgi:hypothetical protein